MTAPPTATLTFLFTDIEGSTRRWEQQRAAMAAALERHDALFRSAIEAYGGMVLKTIGDASCAVFSIPTVATPPGCRSGLGQPRSELRGNKLPFVANYCHALRGAGRSGGR